MGHLTIRGLRFRRVTIVNNECTIEKRSRSRAKSVHGALICCRCTAVVADEGQAERHLCLPRYYLAGVSFADIETIPLPHDPRQRVAVAHHLHHRDLWPYGVKLLLARKKAPLSERYETLSVLLAELAVLERQQELKPKQRRRSAQPTKSAAAKNSEETQ